MGKSTFVLCQWPAHKKGFVETCDTHVPKGYDVYLLVIGSRIKDTFFSDSRLSWICLSSGFAVKHQQPLMI